MNDLIYHIYCMSFRIELHVFQFMSGNKTNIFVSNFKFLSYEHLKAFLTSVFSAMLAQSQHFYHHTSTLLPACRLSLTLYCRSSTFSLFNATYVPVLNSRTNAAFQQKFLWLQREKRDGSKHLPQTFFQRPPRPSAEKSRGK